MLPNNWTGSFKQQTNRTKNRSNTTRKLAATTSVDPSAALLDVLAEENQSAVVFNWMFNWSINGCLTARSHLGVGRQYFW